MRKFALGKHTSTKYASSDGSTAENATTPDLLANGSFGFYGVNSTGLSLIAASANWATISAFTTICLFVGGDGEVIPVFQCSPTEFKSYTGSKFKFPLEEIRYVGYDNVGTGDLNTPTVALGDSASISINTKLATKNPMIPVVKTYDSGKLLASATDVDVVSEIIKNINDSNNPARQAIASLVCDGSVAALTGSATLYKFTKGSKTVSVHVPAYSGSFTATASTASVTKGNLISVPSSYVREFSFAADALGSSAGRHIIIIGTTVYNVADAGTDEQNATAIAAAINAGTQATATVSSATVTVKMKGTTRIAYPAIYSTPNDSTFTKIDITFITGHSGPTCYVVAATTSSAATFELTYPYEGETGYFIEGNERANDVGVCSSITAYGVQIAAYNLYESLDVYVGGVIEDATLTLSQGMYYGSGTYRDIANLENMYLGYRGKNDNELPNRNPKEYANKSIVYDIYTLSIEPTYDTHLQPKGSNLYTVSICIETGGTNTSGHNQNGFDDIVATWATGLGIATTVLVS